MGPKVFIIIFSLVIGVGFVGAFYYILFKRRGQLRPQEHGKELLTKTACSFATTSAWPPGTEVSPLMARLRIYDDTWVIATPLSARIVPLAQVRDLKIQQIPGKLAMTVVQIAYEDDARPIVFQFRVLGKNNPALPFIHSAEENIRNS